jgi:hypothetical protein
MVQHRRNEGVPPNLPSRETSPAELGSAVYLNGLVYTAREGVYKKVLDEGVPCRWTARSLQRQLPLLAGRGPI